MQESEIAEAIDGLSILLKPITIPAFSGKQMSYWSKYDALAKAGITEITVTTDLHGFRIDNFAYLQIKASFDPQIYDTEKFGLVYGDDTFESAFTKHLSQVLRAPLDGPRFHYTEAGMQGDDYISLEGGEDWMEYLIGLSSHERLAISQSPQVDSFYFPSPPRL